MEHPFMKAVERIRLIWFQNLVIRKKWYRASKRVKLSHGGKKHVRG